MPESKKRLHNNNILIYFQANVAFPCPYFKEENILLSILYHTAEPKPKS